MLKEIPNFKNYFVDENGNVYSTMRKELYKIKQQDNKYGYKQTTLVNDDGERQTRLTHRLMALAFFTAFDENKHEIDHINGIRDDNRLDNLRLSNKIDNHNMPRAVENVKLGLKFSKEFNRLKHLNNQEKAKKVVVGERVYESISEAAKYEKVSRTTIRKRINSKNFPNYQYLGK